MQSRQDLLIELDGRDLLLQPSRQPSEGGAEHQIGGQACSQPQAREEHLVNQTIFEPGMGNAGERRLGEPPRADDPGDVDAPPRA